MEGVPRTHVHRNARCRACWPLLVRTPSRTASFSNWTTKFATSTAASPSASWSKSRPQNAKIVIKKATATTAKMTLARLRKNVNIASKIKSSGRQLQHECGYNEAVGWTGYALNKTPSLWRTSDNADSGILQQNCARRAFQSRLLT